MKRSAAVVVACALIVALFSIPASAADPGVSKRVLATDDGTTVLVIRVSASGNDIYGISVGDESGSVVDIVSPNGWSGVAAGDFVTFDTIDRPIKAGSSKSFRIITTNKDASLTIRFRDMNSMIGTKKAI